MRPPPTPRGTTPRAHHRRHHAAPELQVPAPHFCTCPIPYALRVLLQANATDTMLQASATANRGGRRLSRVLEVSTRVATRCSKYTAVSRRLQPWRSVGALPAADARRSSAGRRYRRDGVRCRHRHLTCARDGGAARDRRVCVATRCEDGVEHEPGIDDCHGTGRECRRDRPERRGRLFLAGGLAARIAGGFSRATAVQLLHDTKARPLVPLVGPPAYAILHHPLAGRDSPTRLQFKRQNAKAA